MQRAVKNDDGSLSRGYKLATLRTLLERPGLYPGAVAPIQVHMSSVPVDAISTHLRVGDLLLEDNGFMDGA